MGYEYDEATIGGERWLILNDAKGDEPRYAWIVGVEERQRKDGKGSFPVLVMKDENGAVLVCSAFARQVEKIIREWGTITDNWKGYRIELKREGKNILLLPAEEQPKEERIAEAA